MDRNPSEGFDLAIKEAWKAYQHDDVPVGAVLYLRGKRIASAHNCREKSQSPLAHAEILCIQKAAKKIGSWNLSGATLWVTLEPCPMCLGLIQQARISQVIYGAADHKGGALALGYQFHQDQRMHHRFTVTFQEDARCSKILSQFFSEKRRMKKRKS